MSPGLARSPRRGPIVACAACFLFLLGVALPVRAQLPNEPDPTAKHSRARAFKMPFHFPAADQDRVQSLKLYVAPPGGRDWQLHATATPAQARAVAGNGMLQGNFDIRLERDGAYDFAIMTVYSDGRSNPESVAQLRSDQRVIIDTLAPSVGLTATQPRQRQDGKVEVGIEWRISDENLDVNSIRLEGRYVGGLPSWANLVPGIALDAQGKREWTLAGRRMEVRLSAFDRAGNRAEKYLVLGAGVGQTTGASAEPGGAPRDYNSSDGQPAYTIVNDKVLRLQMKVFDKPLSGLAALELWSTRSGSDWQKVNAEFKPPAENADTAEFTYQVPEDGTYGLTLVARSNANVPQPAPRGNQPPQIWVVVDTKPPEATLVGVKFAQPSDPRTLVLTWKARDEHLEALPVIFEYAPVGKDGNAGKWQALTEGLANTGRHVCATPNLPEGFHQFKVRMTVIDRAGNSTDVDHKDPISIDVNPPRVGIIGVKPTKPNKPDAPLQP